ncbi:MAG: class I SAM-dependent methyltransferase, partial [Actinobacteria bacterium]|nr:class I SAM-dependent methyltransferase [Actinomycetota bacterium]
GTTPEPAPEAQLKPEEPAVEGAQGADAVEGDAPGAAAPAESTDAGAAPAAEAEPTPSEPPAEPAPANPATTESTEPARDAGGDRDGEAGRGELSPEERARRAAELEPVAEALVRVAAPTAGDRVLDVACGTGNAALLAAARGADVVGVDSSKRLIALARQRAQQAGLFPEFLVGDALVLPVGDGGFDVVLSVFGVIFAADPAQAMSEVARVLRSDGRAYITAWVPSGPINAMLTVFGRAVGRATGASPPKRFAWSDTDAVRSIAEPAGLLVSTTRGELEIRAPSPEAYVAAGREHPMGVDAWPMLERSEDVERLREEMLQALAAGNEDPPRLLIRSPYVVHELRPVP